MAIITISRGSYSRGKEVAEKVAEKLHYAALSRDIVLEASEDFNIPEIKLIRALHDAPSILERFTFGKERYMAYIESALLEHFRKDNIVYHGLAGHFMVDDLHNVLKVRIIADMEDRVRTEMKREKISRGEALRLLQKDDRERREWSRALYGIDTWDASLYDLVIHIHKLSVANAVDLICDAARRDQFKTTPEAQRSLNNRALAAKVKAAVVGDYPKVSATATDGEVLVHVKAAESSEAAIVNKIECMAAKIPGVKGVKVHLIPTTLFP